MYFGNEAIENINNVVMEDAFSEEPEVVEEAVLFISKEARELKKKLKETIKAEFAEYRNKGFGEKLKGGFNGEKPLQPSALRPGGLGDRPAGLKKRHEPLGPHQPHPRGVRQHPDPGDAHREHT